MANEKYFEDEKIILAVLQPDTSYDHASENMGDYHVVFYEKEDGKVGTQEWWSRRNNNMSYEKAHLVKYRSENRYWTYYINPKYFEKLELKNKKVFYNDCELEDRIKIMDYDLADGFNTHKIIKAIIDKKCELVRNAYRMVDKEILVTETGKTKFKADDILFIEQQQKYVYVLEKDNFTKYDFSKVEIEFDEIIDELGKSKKFHKINFPTKYTTLAWLQKTSNVELIKDESGIVIDKKYFVRIDDILTFELVEHLQKIYDALCKTLKEFVKLNKQKCTKKEIVELENAVFNQLCSDALSQESMLKLATIIGVFPYVIFVRSRIADDLDSLMKKMNAHQAIDPDNRYELAGYEVFPINFETVEEFKKLINSKQKPNKTHKVGSVKLVYDLPGAVSTPQVMDEFLDALRDYINLTKNERVKKLFEKKPKEVKVSKILQAIDGGKVWYYSDGDLDLFHSTVTKCLLSSGWFTDYPAMWFDVKNTYMLRLDTIKYIIANWDWVAWIYNSIVLENFIRIYGELSLEESAFEEDVIRRSLVTKFINTMDTWENTDTRIFDYIESKRHPFFENSDFAPTETSANSTFIDSLEPKGYQSL